MQLAEAVEAELLLAVEAAQVVGGLVVEQAGGGDQRAAVQVAHADVLAVRIVVIHVEAELGALQLGVELGAEHGKAQGLRLAQRGYAFQALGPQAARTLPVGCDAVAGHGDLGHE
ncbi:hypothetical protein D9M71_356460 [compost metagenome]